MKEIVFEVEQELDGSFVAEAKISPQEQIITQGSTIEELKMMIKDAIECHFDNEDDMPTIVRLHIVTNEIFALA